MESCTPKLCWGFPSQLTQFRNFLTDLFRVLSCVILHSIKLSITIHHHSWVSWELDGKNVNEEEVYQGADGYPNNPCWRLWRWKAHSGEEDLLGSRVQGMRPWHPHLVLLPFGLVYMKDTFMFTLLNTCYFIHHLFLTKQPYRSGQSRTVCAEIKSM